ncbi:MAG TPA: DUF4037 domain-containing protein [Caulobacteraceae bacterium]
MDSISGMELSRRFYGELVRPWLARAFPDLRHAAALIGAGSELLGFDDAMSRDHDWGPRVLLFVAEADFAAQAEAVADGFAAVAPTDFLGHPLDLSRTRTGDPDGARRDPRHGLEIHTLEAMLRRTLALGLDEPRDAVTWLGLSEQRLLAVTTGAVFHDDDGRLTGLRARLGAFPRDVRLYKLACQWRRIAEEQAFVGRAGHRGDDLGSKIIAARLVRDAMRMGFLIEGRYAPYPKWFAAAFAQLPCAPDLTPMFERALAASDWKAREATLAEAYLALANLHKTRGLPGAFAPALGPFHDRPFMVINADAIGAVIAAEIVDPALRVLPIIGSLDQVTDSTPLIEAPDRARRAMRALFDDGEA